MRRSRTPDVRGYLYLASAAVLSFAAFYVFFGVSVAPVVGVIVVALLFAGAGLLFKRGADQLWSDDDRR